ncbi:MAG TPA: glycosyltransferase family 39 protein [Elusimicrobiota bacterium]|nr:glycosyltransferase family 39 protein [Elusimicrobiota bacterium]
MRSNNGKSKVGHPGRMWLNAGAIFSCWALFLILLRRLWPYQGVFTGEALSGIAAYAWIHQIPNMFMGPSAAVFGWNIPLMYSNIHGPWSIYFLSPFIALGGCTLATLRIYSAFMFLFALWGTWRLALLVSGNRAAAFLSAALLAVCPAMAMTRSEYVTAPDVAASVWALCFALSFVRTRKPAYAWAACAAFFMGLCTRTWVAGLGVGFVLYALLTWRKVLTLFPAARGAKARLIGGCLACAGIFLLPILIYNALNGWPCVWFYARRFANRQLLACGLPGQEACSNLAYWINLKFNVRQLESLCDGPLGILVRAPWHWLYAATLLLSLAFAARSAWRRRTLWSATAALWIIAIGYFLIAAVSPTDQLAIHLTPLVPILAVLAVSWIADVPAGRPRAALLCAMALVCAAQFAGDVRLFRRENIDISSAGGARGWYGASPLIITASRWAGQEARIPIISLSHPFTSAAPYFSQGRAVLIPWPDWISDYRFPWKEWLRRKDRPYFLIENDSLGAAKATELKAEAAKLGAPLARVRVLRDSRGRPAFEVYRVR